ncbi:MAG: DUF2812 domain-containing protein [Alicyclobacillus shizuokensis]|nr:DUF2812 domain-containing protein [Alicyclobacillus shizuokensis]
MHAKETKRLVFWVNWNYEKREKWFDRMSAQGLHLQQPGLFLNTFVRDDQVRYVYRLDYQPQLRKPALQGDYVTLFQDAGWEHLGQCAGWHYFRQPWQPGREQKLYTDRTSLLQHYKRIQHVLGILLLAEIAVLGTSGTNLLIVMPRTGLNLWLTVVPVLAVYAAVVVLLGYGWVKMGRKINTMESRE